MENDKLLVGIFLGMIFGGAMIAILTASKSKPSGSPSIALTPVARNEEVWEWVDYRGRPRRLVVHREVEKVGRA